ncbi:MAG: hypothetical protein BGO78_03760 [Chloroflexi bacterium 44-23]|nr:MAG: hypothetical protein BGO78_03760 [Chloroflexi bacterium 44-23]
MVKILHFSDAHIDLAIHGKRDPASGLPYRILDFLKALDTIVDCAIETPVDLVIFAGDAYRDRSPAPTYQKEWGKRMMQLSKAGIPVILLVGNHDYSPAFGRAHAMQEYDTFSIANIHVIDTPRFLTPDDLNGLPIQVIALPWISKSNYLALRENSTLDQEDLNEELEDLITGLVQQFIQNSDALLPLVLTAHASVQGAVYGGERNILLGKDYTLPGSLVKNSQLDYVALGHIHKPQNLNEGYHPPVVYPGSIERIDFGEIEDQKYFVIVDLEKGKANLQWVPLHGRIFIDNIIDLRKLADLRNDGVTPNHEEVMAYIKEHLPDQEEISDSVARLTIYYPREWEALIDTGWIHRHYENALEAHIIHKPIANVRLRLGDEESVSEMEPLELLDRYLYSSGVQPEEVEILKDMATEIIYNERNQYNSEVGS